MSAYGGAIVLASGELRFRPQSFSYCGHCDQYFMSCTCHGIPHAHDFNFKCLPRPPDGSTPQMLLRRWCSCVAQSSSMGRFEALKWYRDHSSAKLRAMANKREALNDMVEEYVARLPSDPHLPLLAKAIGIRGAPAEGAPRLAREARSRRCFLRGGRLGHRDTRRRLAAKQRVPVERLRPLPLGRRRARRGLLGHRHLEQGARARLFGRGLVPGHRERPRAARDAGGAGRVGPLPRRARRAAAEHAVPLRLDDAQAHEPPVVPPNPKKTARADLAIKCVIHGDAGVRSLVLASAAFITGSTPPPPSTLETAARPLGNPRSCTAARATAAAFFPSETAAKAALRRARRRGEAAHSRVPFSGGAPCRRSTALCAARGARRPARSGGDPTRRRPRPRPNYRRRP